MDLSNAHSDLGRNPGPAAGFAVLRKRGSRYLILFIAVAGLLVWGLCRRPSTLPVQDGQIQASAGQGLAPSGKDLAPAGQGLALSGKDLAPAGQGQAAAISRDYDAIACRPDAPVGSVGDPTSGGAGFSPPAAYNIAVANPEGVRIKTIVNR